MQFPRIFCSAKARFRGARLTLWRRGLDGSFAFDSKAKSNLIILLEKSSPARHSREMFGAIESRYSKPDSMP
jgi:hypothetical protein